MKLKYIFASIVATLALAVSCEKEADHYLSEIQVEKSYVGFAQGGSSVTIALTATGSWTVNIPASLSWLTATPTSGGAGSTTITLTAASTDDTREGTITITCDGKTQSINVIQQAEKTERPVTPIADAIAAGAGSFRLRGTVTRVANEQYGNFYIEDATGNIYIYGVKDAQGYPKDGNGGWARFGIDVGDIVTVEGPYTLYGSTPELVDAEVIKVEKSLIKVISVDPEDGEIPQEGGNVIVTLENKGDGLDVTLPESASWLSVSGINTSTGAVTFSAPANAGGDREVEVVFLTSSKGVNYSAMATIKQKGAIMEVSVAEFLAAPVSTTVYKLSGAITRVANETYGNVDLRDYSGETYVYGIGASGDFAKYGLKLGDIVTLTGNRGEYNGNPQMTKGQYVSHISVTEADIPTVLAAEDGGYYRVSGTVKSIANTTYGNLTLTDGTNDIYVYGTYPGWGAAGDARKGVVADKGIEEGDVLTVYGPKSTYNGTPQINGGFFWSLVKATPGGDEPGGDTPGGDAQSYVLTVTSGSNNSYANNCDIEIGGITWNLTGNSQMDPWRIGGKSITATDRELYSKTPIAFDVASIAVEHGTVTDITVNSWTLVVSTNADFSAPVSTLTGTVTADETYTFTRPDGVSWNNCYFKFVYNVTVTASSNKFVQFKKATFTAGE